MYVCVSVMWERQKYGVSSAFGACVYHGGDVRRNMLNIHRSLLPQGHRGPSVAAFTGLKKRDTSTAFGVGTGTLVILVIYRERLC